MKPEDLRNEIINYKSKAARIANSFLSKWGHDGLLMIYQLKAFGVPLYFNFLEKRKTKTFIYYVNKIDWLERLLEKSTSDPNRVVDVNFKLNYCDRNTYRAVLHLSEGIGSEERLDGLVKIIKNKCSSLYVSDEELSDFSAAQAYFNKRLGKINKKLEKTHGFVIDKFELLEVDETPLASHF